VVRVRADFDEWPERTGPAKVTKFKEVYTANALFEEAAELALASVGEYIGHPHWDAEHDGKVYRGRVISKSVVEAAQVDSVKAGTQVILA
jgi:hypothetical protein